MSILYTSVTHHSVCLIDCLRYFFVVLMLEVIIPSIMYLSGHDVAPRIVAYRFVI
jgi:hypothetical protein